MLFRFKMFFHGADMKKLHKHIPAEFWPSNYGGTLPEIDYSGKDWYPAVVKRNQLYVDWATYGFKWDAKCVPDALDWQLSTFIDNIFKKVHVKVLKCEIEIYFLKYKLPHN